MRIIAGLVVVVLLPTGCRTTNQAAGPAPEPPGTQAPGEVIGGRLGSFGLSPSTDQRACIVAKIAAAPDLAAVGQANSALNDEQVRGLVSSMYACGATTDFADLFVRSVPSAEPLTPVQVDCVRGAFKNLSQGEVIDLISQPGSPKADTFTSTVRVACQIADPSQARPVPTGSVVPVPTPTN